jgi:hypothetical protein
MARGARLFRVQSESADRSEEDFVAGCAVYAERPAATTGGKQRGTCRRVRSSAGLGITVQLQQFTKLLNSEAGVSDDTAKGESVDRVVAKDGQNARPA